MSDINNGRCLRRPNEIYPLYRSNHTGLTDETYLKIIDLLLNSNYTITSIAKYLKLSKDTVSKVNNGYQKKVHELYNGTFPIRKNSHKNYTLKPVETISSEIGSTIIIDT